MSVTVRSVCITETSSKLAGRRWSGWRGVAMLVLLAGELAACNKVKPVHYYQLTHPPTTALSNAQAPIDASLLVRLFQGSHLYREDRVVYGDNNVELGVYDYNRWAQPPIDLLQDALARGLRSSNQFRAVTTLRSDTSVDYYLTGQIYAFREVDNDGSAIARLAFDVELMDPRKGKMIWRHSYNHDEPSAEKTVGGLATAMDKNVHMAVQEIQDGLVQALTEYTRNK